VKAKEIRFEGSERKNHFNGYFQQQIFIIIFPHPRIFLSSDAMLRMSINNL